MPAASDIAFLKEAEKRATELISEARDERKSKMREAQAEVKREVEAYRALREAKLRAPQPEGAALDAKVARVTAEVDRAIAGLETEYTANRETVVKLLLQVVTMVDNPFAGKK